MNKAGMKTWMSFLQKVIRGNPGFLRTNWISRFEELGLFPHGELKLLAWKHPEIQEEKLLRLMRTGGQKDRRTEGLKDRRTEGQMSEFLQYQPEQRA